MKYICQYFYKDFFLYFRSQYRDKLNVSSEKKVEGAEVKDDMEWTDGGD